MSFFRDSKPAPVNFIWVGPPVDEKSGVPGHETIGPDQMAEAGSDNRLVFWCLDEYVAHYQKRFQGKPIEIRSIENYVQHALENKDFADDAKKLDAIIKTLLHNDRNKTIDRVGVKVAFSLFLHRTEGGYTSDTNVRPMQGQRVSLPSYPKFCMPKFSDDVDPKVTDVDIWLMFSPQYDHRTAKEIFDHYLFLHEQREALEKYSQAYHDSSGMPSISAAQRQWRNNNVSFWKAIELGERKNYASVPELKLIKSYYNTHKFDAKEKPDELFSAIADNDIPKLIHLLDNGDDVNRRINLGEDKDLTPLHLAVAEGKLKCAEILLAKGADFNLIAYFNDENVTPYQVAKYLGANDMMNLIQDERWNKLAQHLKAKSRGI